MIVSCDMGRSAPRRHEPLSQEWIDERAVWEPNTGCLLWTRGQNQRGYGTTLVNGDRKAHRVFYKHFVGPVAYGEPRRAIAARYGVCLGTISQLVNGNTWKHLPRVRSGR